MALATVLAMQPDVLLLDEPRRGLDDAASARLIGVLAGLPQAMLVVSHQPAFRQAVTQGTLAAERPDRAGRVIRAAA